MASPSGGAGAGRTTYASQDSTGAFQTQLYTEDAEAAGGGGAATQEGYWGRLVPLSKGFRHVELKNSQTEYTFGRSKDRDVRLTDVHISSKHCKVYRAPAPAGKPLPPDVPPTVFVEDTSANGTFVNKVRLVKGEPHVLNPGDQLSLVVPAKDENSTFASFVFQQLTASVVKEEHIRRTTSSTQRKIGDFYSIRDKLGAGSYAEVRRAINKKTGDHFAVKIIDKRKFALVPGFRMENLLREAEVLAQLDHPSIIALKDLFQTEDTLYIVTELVTGGELFDRLIGKGAYTEDDGRLLFLRLLKAIQYLHDRNIVHRDLKPENILIKADTDDTQVKIADFGVAKALGFEGLKTYCGSPQYFAPEVLRRRDTVFGEGRYGKGADMWSMGVILYVVLSASPPFAESALQSQFENVKFNFSSSRWKGISAKAKDLIRKLMCADPSARYSVDEALAHPWFKGVVDPMEPKAPTVGRSVSGTPPVARVPSATPEEDTAPAAPAAGAGAAAPRNGAGVASPGRTTRKRAREEAPTADVPPMPTRRGRLSRQRTGLHDEPEHDPEVKPRRSTRRKS